MAIRNAQPMRFTPTGLSDSFDSSDAFPGACQSLQNLIFDQSNRNLVVPRPGVFLKQSLGGFLTSPTFISCYIVVGTRVYGMCATSRFAGHDEPFCMDLATGTIYAPSGVTSGNTPTSPSTTGDWTPPTMASVGVYVIVTHPGFNGSGSNFFGVFDLTNPNAPVWSSRNTGTNALPSVPVAVANFNNRAYFACSNQTLYTDVLALTRTNATQALTLGDSTAIVALSGLPVQTTSSGIVQSLTAFKNSQIWQITGDTTTANLAENYISLTIGTKAPRSIAQAPVGLYFMSTAGGPYIIDPVGSLRPLTHDLQETVPDVQAPFQNAQTPSRWAGAYIASVYRLCGPTVLLGKTVTNDYWFDEHRRRWNGPHTFLYDCAAGYGNTFILSSYLNPGQLIESDIVPGLSPLYTDLGNAYGVNMLSSTFPRTNDMFTKQVVESQIELGGKPGGASYFITAVNENGTQLAQTNPGALTIANTGLKYWGGAGLTWGQAGLTWTNSQNQAPYTYQVPWSTPFVFEKMALWITATAAQNLAIGTFYARFQRTGYMTMNQAA